MKEIIKINSVGQYFDFFGLKSKNPLVGVIDLSKAEQWSHKFSMNFGVYCLLLMTTKCGDIRYGRCVYDFREGTIISYAPGQIIDVEIFAEQRPTALGLIFHPDFISDTPLAKSINRYSFFSYASTEALHLSDSEKANIKDCLGRIKEEIESPDDYSKDIIVMQIELLLSYCDRYYQRQFESRKEPNKDILTRFELLIDNYLRTGLAVSEGVPTVKYFADKICLSPNYFGDLVNKLTGQSAQVTIQNKMINFAKEQLNDPKKTITDIAYSLGFQSPQSFSKMFKRSVGCSPNKYKEGMSGY
ncbi:MAG: helix-turn-helix domain-containing protein [Prevotellaceae bacterium]|nr:helix-turn-helix domain-containing protein [Prevotellaceae bacterium]